MHEVAESFYQQQFFIQAAIARPVLYYWLIITNKKASQYIQLFFLSFRYENLLEGGQVLTFLYNIIYIIVVQIHYQKTSCDGKVS